MLRRILLENYVRTKAEDRWADRDSLGCQQVSHLCSRRRNNFLSCLLCPNDFLSCLLHWQDRRSGSATMDPGQWSCDFEPTTMHRFTHKAEWRSSQTLSNFIFKFSIFLNCLSILVGGDEHYHAQTWHQDKGDSSQFWSIHAWREKRFEHACICWIFFLGVNLHKHLGVGPVALGQWPCFGLRPGEGSNGDNVPWVAETRLLEAKWLFTIIISWTSKWWYAHIYC